MLKNFSFTRRRVITVAALLGICSSSLPLCAQENPTVAPAKATQRLIPVRNVKASLIAYWLDSATQDKPLDLRMSQSFNVDDAFRGLPRLPGNANGPVDLKLPAGIERIIAIDPQNAILAFGTKEGLDALANLIPTLDVSLVQYEVEAQFLALSRADFPKMRLDFGDIAKKDPSFIGAVVGGRNFNADIARMIAEGKMKVLTAPRVTVMDGLSAQLQQSTMTPFVLNQEAFKQAATEGTAKWGDTPETRLGASPEMLQGMAYVTTTIGLKATTHQNKNDLVSLSVTPMLGSRSVSVAATVRDGESFAIQLSPANEEKQVIVVVTTRRIRRIGDDVVGTIAR